MNTQQLAKNVGQVFHLRPMPLRVQPDGTELPQVDDDWRLDAVLTKPARVRLVNTATHHAVELESDNIQERRSPNFLLLRCQLTLRGRRVDIEPIPRAGAAPPSGVRDKFVSLDYVEKAGIAPRLRTEGHTLNWIRADREAEAIDLNGWEYVEQIDSNGSRVRFKVRDSSCDYLVLVMRG